MTFGDFHYDRERKSLLHQIELLEEYKIVNDFLKQNDWLFIAPLFFRGFELNQFFALSKKSGNQKSAINKIIFRKFYQLETTAIFTEGYCNRCKHIKPFLFSIEQSFVSAFQRDYEGAIKTLIPIVEGILRQYLVHEKGIVKTIQFQKLRKSFVDLKDDLIEDYKNGLLVAEDQNHNKIDYTQAQIDDLVILRSTYYTIWFSFLIEFIDNSFYLNTTAQNITNELNRHAILHEFGIAVSYDLENYIKVYFVIQFLAWIFLQKENQSVLCEINGFRYFEKVVAYQNIIKSSKNLVYDKNILYKEHGGYNAELLREEFEIKFEDLLPRTKMMKYAMLKGTHKFFWTNKKKILNMIIKTSIRFVKKK